MTSYRSHDVLGHPAERSVDAALATKPSSAIAMTNPGQRELLLPERPVT